MYYRFDRLMLTAGIGGISLFSYAQEIKGDSLPQSLSEIVIVNTNPIAEKYASIQLRKMEVYFNPAASGDPLKAISILPLSTNTTESASPVLRGGRAEQSLVYLNGAPIVNPVRHTQDDGVGSFSLFNLELIDNQYVYASNPPLTYGNASAGIVSIESTKELERDSYQVVAALSTLGVQLNKKIGKTDFVQFYGNLQFAPGIKAINRRSLEELNDFKSKDGGLNVNVKLSPSTVLNSYSYAIDEVYDAENYNLIYRSSAKAGQKRFFTVNSLGYTQAQSLFKLVSLVDWRQSSYRFKAIDSNVKNTVFYFSASHKYRINYSWNLQYGGDLTNTTYTYDEVKPLVYYAMEAYHPTITQQEELAQHIASVFLYTDYKFSNRVGVSLGVRKNWGLKEGGADFLSQQFSAFYKVNENHRLIVGVGDYHSYLPPNYYNHAIEVMRSQQFALDYYYERGNTSVTGAVYWKRDKGKQQLSAIERLSDQRILGLEWSYNQLLGRFFSFFISNSLLRRQSELNGKDYSSWALFSKGQLTYSDPKYATVSLVINSHPGEEYRPVSAGGYDTQLGVFIPRETSANSVRMNPYFRLDLTANRLIPLGKNYLVIYGSLVNVLNRKNQRKPHYSFDYTQVEYQYFQQRVLYLGLQFKF